MGRTANVAQQVRIRLGSEFARAKVRYIFQRFGVCFGSEKPDTFLLMLFSQFLGESVLACEGYDLK